jgi:opacity protein-like surface antigen
MIMKKLIAIAVVFALAAGGLFAADLGVTVQGNVNLVKGSSASGDKAVGTGGYGGLAVEGAGENDDGTFGAWYRFSPNEYGHTWDGGIGVMAFSGFAWWKPIDQFKLTIGGNPDGIFPKEGFSAWMFYQRANDSGVVVDDMAWGWNDYIIGGGNRVCFRNAFYGGFAAPGLLLEIKPLDMFSLNVVLPYFDKGGAELAGVFKNMVIQADLNFDFGNIALTFDMYDRMWPDSVKNKVGGRIFLFFGLNSIENLDFAFSAGFSLPEDDDMEQVAIGLAAKYSISDAFSIKARVLALFAGKDKGSKNPFDLMFEVQPGFAINDNVKVFAALGLNMMLPDGGDTIIGWHLNPYLWIGQEWGPSFFAGIKLYNDVSSRTTKSSVIKFAVPIGLNIGF